MKRALAIVAVAGAAIATAAAPAAAAHARGDLTVGLNGANEVGTEGDRDGSGKIELSFFAAVDNPTVAFPGEYYVCSDLTVRNIDDVVAMHIHEGDRKSSGPVVVDLLTDSVEHPEGTCVSVPEDTFDEIVEDPAEYYVNVHTAEHPGGAIRGQLHEFS